MKLRQGNWLALIVDEPSSATEAAAILRQQGVGTAIIARRSRCCVCNFRNDFQPAFQLQPLLIQWRLEMRLMEV